MYMYVDSRGTVTSLIDIMQEFGPVLDKQTIVKFKHYRRDGLLSSPGFRLQKAEKERG